MRIVDLSDAVYEPWERFVESHPSGTIYHTSTWMRLLQETFGYMQKGFALLDGDRVVGGLPLFEVKGFRGKRLVSSPFRDRGGILVSPGANTELLVSEAVRTCSEGKYDFLVIKEETPLGLELMQQQGFTESSFWITTTVDLTKGSKEIWRHLKNNAQGPVKQAERAGVDVRFAESRKEMEIFYDIFFLRRKRMGIPSFSKEFFMGIWNGLCLEGKGRLLLAYQGRTPIAGILLLLHKEKVLDGYAASALGFRDARPNDLLVWRAIEWASGEGYSIFDFGADSPSQKSLLAFKRKWAGVHKPMHHYFLLNRTGAIELRDSSEGKYSLARGICRRLPASVFRAVSALTVARLG